MHTPTSTLDQATVKNLVNSHLEAYCAERRAQSAAISERYATLWDSIERLLRAGGKRFRPYMLIASYSAYAENADIEDILPAALSQELLHSAMLIHDDIIDRDIIRYGVKNVAGQYIDEYASFTSNQADREHLSMSMAILAGDILLSDAHHILRRTNCLDEHVQRAGEVLSTSVFEVIGGELLDTESAILPKGMTDAETIARYKTASYSFVSPLRMGAILAGAPPSETKLLTELALSLGIGYQLRDDYLGVFGDSEETGKSTSTDITEGKRTFLIEQFDAIATHEQKTEFYEIFHTTDTTPEQTNRARTLLIESGAQSALEERIENAQHDVAAKIEHLNISTEMRQVFHDLAKKCLERTA